MGSSRGRRRAGVRSPPSTYPQGGGRCLRETRRLGHSEFRPRAQTAFRLAEAAFLSIGRPSSAAAAATSLAAMRLEDSADDHKALRQVVEDLEQSCRALSASDTPLIWINAQVLLGDAHQALGRFEDTLRYEQAERCYRKALDALTLNKEFAPDDRRDAIALLHLAASRLKDLDSRGIPEPVFPPGFLEREPRGSILFLRPLATAGKLLVPNQFRNPQSFAVQYPVEPDPITVEAALYRALGENFSISSVGGRNDAFGPTRLYMSNPSDWQTIFRISIKNADGIVMIPDGSPGVRWELEQIAAGERIRQCLRSTAAFCVAERRGTLGTGRPGPEGFRHPLPCVQPHGAVIPGRLRRPGRRGDPLRRGLGEPIV